MGLILVGRERERERVRGAVRSGAGAVVAGPMGVGKTHLARAVLDDLDPHRFAVHRIVATASTRTVPLGAVAMLLPQAPMPPRHSTLLGAVARGVTEQAGGRRTVLGVDDAHLLDDGSAAVLHHLVVSGTAVVLATVRAGEPCPDAVTALWKDDGAARIELAELDPEDAHRLAQALLGAGLSTELWAALWKTARGSPLFLTELVHSARGAGSIEVIDDEARLSGTLGPSARLAEVLDGRLARCSPGARTCLEMLAVAEPLPVAVLEAATDQAALPELEHAGLATVERHGARLGARAAHPAIAETVRASMSEATRRLHARQLIDAFEAQGLRRSEDLLQVCVLRLEADSFEQPDRFLEAAALALDRFDARLAERLVRPVLDSADPVEARLLLGKALRSSHSGSEAAEHLVAAASQAADTSQRARAALELAQTQFYELQRPTAAMATLTAARRTVDEDPWGYELDALQALLATLIGDVHTAADLAEGVLDATRGDRAVLHVLATSTVANLLLGRLDQAAHVLGSALPLAADAPADAALAAQLLLIDEFSLDLYAGRVAASVTKARTGFERVTAAQATDVVGLWGSTLLIPLLPAGRTREAVTVAREAVAALEMADPLGLHAATSAMQARAHAEAGDVETAKRVLASIPAQRHRADARLRYHLDHAAVWVTAADGRLTQAAELAREGGCRALGADLVVFAAELLHAAVRLDHPAIVVDRLAAIAEQVGRSSLADAFHDHAQVLTAGDATEVLRVAERFARMGATLLAAEAAAQGSRLLQSAGAQREARKAAMRARELAARCDGAQTPALVLAPQPLTAREYEVAVRAVSHLSNRDISTQLGVSKRTVDNHIASIYRKLGITGREALAEILGP